MSSSVDLIVNASLNPLPCLKMYHSSSKNLCTSKIIRDHLKRWLMEGYLLKQRDTKTALAPTASSVALLLVTIEQEGFIDLISQNEMYEITVCYNSECSEGGTTHHLPFVYKTKGKTILPLSPVREGNTRNNVYLSTSN